MKRQTFQHPELRDANDNIIQEGTYGKESPLVNSTNDGVLDYINNNLEALHDAQTAAGNAITTGTLTVTGKTTTGTLDAGDTTVTGTVKTGGLTVTGKTTTGTLEASSATVSGQTTTGTLAAGDTTVTGSITTTGLTVTGETSVPTANEGNSSNAIASTEFVAKSISALVNGAPDQLNTLNELAEALGNDADFSKTVTNLIGQKVAKAGDTITGDVDITGDLSVSGAITGNVTGNVTGAATSATNDGNGNNIASTYLPAVVGVVQAFAGNTLPNGWLLCDGSAVSRTDYAALFAVIGTTYGAGNGSTTFNLPNLVDKFVEGSATAGTVQRAGLPNIKGQWGLGAWGSADVFSGASTQNNAIRVKTAYLDEGAAGIISFDASKSNPIYGSSDTVQPPALTMRYIIKY